MRISTILKDIIVNSKTQSSLRIVSGNQSGDLDSVISAIAYSYFQYIDSAQQIVLPFLNFKRSELRSRKDVELVFKKHGIESTDLLFTDDLPQLKINAVLLVDHNSPQGDLKKYIDKKGSKIIGIIDHHEDEGLYKDAYPRIIEKSGSCSSLVFNFWNKKGVQANQEIANLLIVPLCMDTSNLTFKVEQSDLDAFREYQKLITLDTTILFKDLKEAKDDISSLTNQEILAKDYKFFEFPVGDSKMIKKVGISSVVKPFTWLIENKSSIINDSKDFLIQNGLDFFIIMTSYNDVPGDFKRDLIYFPKNERNGNHSSFLMSYLEKELNLKLVNSGPDYEYYEQLDTSKSRKQVAPAIKEALKVRYEKSND